MFHSNNHQLNFLAACRSNLRDAVVTLLRRLGYFSIVLALTASQAVAFEPQTAPAPAPRNATPIVRPTQYHLLPSIYRSQVDPVPSVADSVPLFDNSSVFRFNSGPINSQDARSTTNRISLGGWPSTAASPGRRFQVNASGLPSRMRAFRPAGIPSKYATTVSEPADRFPHLGLLGRRKQPRRQQPLIQQAQYQVPVTTGPGADLAPAFFEEVENPYVNQPVQQMLSPVRETEASEAAQWQQNFTPTGPWEIQPPPSTIRRMSSIAQSSVTDPMMTPVPPIPGQAFSSDMSKHSDHSDPMSNPILNSMSDPYEHEVHALSRQWDLRQKRSFADPTTLFGQNTTAVLADRQTTFQLDALAWFTSSSSLPILATTSAPGTARNEAGILGTPSTSSLFSDDAFSSAVPGFRIQVAKDFVGYGGIDFEFIQLATRSENEFASSADFPILARPFIDALTGSPSADLIAFPGESTGAVQVALDSRFRTAAIHYYQLAVEQSSSSINDQLVAKLQIGPRVATLQETFSSNDQSFDIVNNTSLQRTDALNVENLFVGGEVGLELNRRFKRVDLSAGVSLAAGANRQKLQGNGQSVFTNSTGQTSVSNSGLFNSAVGASDIKSNKFSLIPAAELGIGFQTKWGWKLSFDYNVILWTNTLRVTDLVPTGLDPRFGAAERPFSSLKDDSYLAHGISLGLERRW